MSQSAPDSATTAKQAGPRINGSPDAERAAPAPAAKKVPAKRAPAEKANGKRNGNGVGLESNGTQQTTNLAPKTMPTPAAKKAPAKRAPSPNGRQPAARALQKTPAPLARTSPALPPQLPIPGTRTVVLSPLVEPVELRRSWFSRRPLAFSHPNWSAGWYEQGRRLTRFRTALVIVPMLIGLAVAGSYGARLLYADPKPVAAQQPDVTCWDQTLAPASDCSLPSGVRGLEWVFQSFDRNDSGCVDVLVEHPDYKRPTMWRCTASVGGRPIAITYSELTSVPSGLTYHQDLFQGAKLGAFPGPDGLIDRYVWRQPEPVDGTWRMAAMYVDFPYAVLIEASTLRDRDRTYRDVVHSRDPKHITTRYE